MPQFIDQPQIPNVATTKGALTGNFTVTQTASVSDTILTYDDSLLYADSNGSILMANWERMVLLAKANTTGCDVLVEYQRAPGDDWNNLTAGTVTLVADTVTDLYPSRVLSDVYAIRISHSNGNAANTLQLMFYLQGK